MSSRRPKNSSVSRGWRYTSRAFSASVRAGPASAARSSPSIAEPAALDTCALDGDTASPEAGAAAPPAPAVLAAGTGALAHAATESPSPATTPAAKGENARDDPTPHEMNREMDMQTSRPRTVPPSGGLRHRPEVTS